MMRGHRGWRELNMLNGDKISKINNFIGGLMSPKSSENKAIAGSKESVYKAADQRCSVVEFIDCTLC